MIVYQTVIHTFYYHIFFFPTGVNVLSLSKTLQNLLNPLGNWHIV